jgi:2-keto-4-pentenoate hydratase
VIRGDAPADKLEWSRKEARAMIRELRIGLEVASSPLAAINDLGPAVTASDFGNNAGLIVGPAIRDWDSRDVEALTCAAYVDDELVGEGGAYGLTGGVVRSVQFMLELAASRGRPLKAGDVIATGQTTGIHDVRPGQSVRMPFGDGNDGELACTIVAA